MNRIVYYYQTFTGLEDLINLDYTPVTHIHIAAIHFGMNMGEYYIHLNDYPPESLQFDTMWKEVRELNNRGVQIRLMVGGGGGAFYELFNNFDNYYPLLKRTIDNRPWINGIDLDVEEGVGLDNIVMLINRIKADFGEDFKITLAPIGVALECDLCGMGGFYYKDLERAVGDKIEYYNGQYYSDFSYDVYDITVKNGYDPSKIVMGMISGQFTSDNFNKCLDEIVDIKEKYNNFGGVFVWEYCNAPPSKNSADWSILINAVINKI